MTLRIALAWSSKWFVRHESLWSVARKLATTHLLSLRQVLERVLCPPEAPSSRLFLRGDPQRTVWLRGLLGLSDGDADGFWLDSTMRGPEDGSVCAGIRYCPTCMRQQFHSTLFQSYLLRTCPVHREALTTRCPRCAAPKLVHSTVTDCFAWCFSCDLPYFPEPRDWLRAYASPLVAPALVAAHAAFARRSSAAHVESAVREWAREPGRVVPEHAPAFALLGDALRGLQRPHADGTCTFGPGVDATCPSWLVSQQLAAVAQLSLGRLADEVGQPASWGLPLHAKSSDLSQAGYLLQRWVGVRNGQSAAEAGRALNNMALSPVLFAPWARGAAQGVIVQGVYARQVCVLAGLRGMYLDALQWVREPAEPHSWDHWPLNRTPALFPTVWTGQLDESGGCSFSLYGPDEDQLRRSAIPTSSVGI